MPRLPLQPVVVVAAEPQGRRILKLIGPLPQSREGELLRSDVAAHLRLISEFELSGVVLQILGQPAERRLVDRLTGELAEASTIRDCAAAILTVSDEMLGYDAAYLVLFPDDRRRSFPIINIDTIDGERQEVTAPFNTRPLSPMNARVLESGPVILLREEGKPAGAEILWPFGNRSRRSGSLMYVPIRKGGEAFGVLSLQKYAFHAYTQRDLERLQEIADHASGALARTFADFKLRQEESVTRALTSLARQLGGIGTVREAGITILETARELFGWDAGFINLVTEDLKTAFPVITYDTIDGRTIVVPPQAQSTQPSPMARSVLQEGAKLLLFDSVNRSPHEEMHNFGDADRLSNSLMFAPIRTAGRTIGLVSIQSYKISAFSMHDLEVFQVLADHVGAALRRIQAEEDLRRKEAQLSDLVKENQLLREQLSQRPLQHPEAFAGIVTESVRMRAIFHQVEAVARSVQPVMISGETGVGKELLARAVHLASGRSGPFIPVNVAGVDDDFFSDTLFGHKRGAYTNAVTERRGFVETAAGGTLFLDEIGDLSLSSQVKLLRLLQEHEYYPIGSDTPRRSEARVVVATNQNLDALIASGHFRKDLFYRLQAHNVRIPPLRERIDDVAPLLAHFVREASNKLGVPTPRIPREIVTLLRQHDFPGNIRELEGIVYDAVAKATRGVLALEHFADKIIFRKTADSASILLARGESQPVTFGDKLPALKEIGDLLVTEALRRTGQNQSMAARLLGVTQQALNQRIVAMKTGQRTPPRPRKAIKKAR